MSATVAPCANTRAFIIVCDKFALPALNATKPTVRTPAVTAAPTNTSGFFLPWRDGRISSGGAGCMCTGSPRRVSVTNEGWSETVSRGDVMTDRNRDVASSLPSSKLAKSWQTPSPPLVAARSSPARGVSNAHRRADHPRRHVMLHVVCSLASPTAGLASRPRPRDKIAPRKTGILKIVAVDHPRVPRRRPTARWWRRILRAGRHRREAREGQGVPGQGAGSLQEHGQEG